MTPTPTATPTPTPPICKIPDTRTYFIDATQHGKPNYPSCQGSPLSDVLPAGTYKFRYVGGTWNFDTRFGNRSDKIRDYFGITFWNGSTWVNPSGIGAAAPEAVHHVSDRGGAPNLYLCIDDGQDKLWNNSGGITAAVDRLFCG